MYRNLIQSSRLIAFGCSHTWGVGVEADETWAYKLSAMNFGVGGVSSDFIARTAPGILEKYKPEVVYILWPDWTRFEYLDNGEYKQSLPADANRINFMAQATDSWLQDNFAMQQARVKELCQQHNTKLVDITLDDLIPFINHADCWPVSKLGHHYSAAWHGWVADIFRKKENE